MTYSRLCRVTSLACVTVSFALVVNPAVTGDIPPTASIQRPNVADKAGPFDISTIGAPISRANHNETTYWDVSLSECIQIALTNSKVVGDLGGVALRTPSRIVSKYDVAVQQTDPSSGTEASLSVYDTTFSANLFFEKNDTPVNNLFFGAVASKFKQDLAVAQAQLQKQTAAGTVFTLRNFVEYDGNNNPGNVFSNAWFTNAEAEVRQPLLQGAGLNFNRIAGSSSSPGTLNGVLIARVNTDLALSDLELGARDFVSDVENAYWDLYYGYRALDAKAMARDSSLKLWRSINALKKAGRRGGEVEKEAQAREQYFRFKVEVENALSGRRLESTKLNNGSSGGTFRGTAGVLIAERRLRHLLGLPTNDGQLIRPSDEPASMKVSFEWDQIRYEAIDRRAELRRQKWQVKMRQLELEGNKGFLKPQLDAVGRYRWRGFGDTFLDTGSNVQEFDGAINNLAKGDNQEWQLGLEFSVPLGRRRAHAAVRHTELQLLRERAVLRQLERKVIQDLSDSVSEVDRAYSVLEANYNRRAAAKEQLAALESSLESETIQLDFVLDAQRRVAEIETLYFASLVEYAIAIKNVHFEKGTLLSYNDVYLTEGDWGRSANADAASRLSKQIEVNSIQPLTSPRRLDRGEHPQLGIK